MLDSPKRNAAACGRPSRTREVTPSVILVLSTGRTGTKFLAHLLGNCLPDVEAHHTTAYSRLFNILGNLYLAGLIPESIIISLWKILKQHEIELSSASIFLDSNPHLVGLVELIERLYPQPKILHIVRDPRTYVRSHLNWAKHRPQSFIADNWVPFWQPNPVLTDGMSVHKWLTLSKFERYCWVWCFKNQLLRDIGNSGVPYLCIRFEDMLNPSEAEATFSQIMCFIGGPEVKEDIAELVENTQQPLNATTRRSFPKWQEWDDATCKRLQAQCDPLMTYYGYGQEPEWIASVSRESKLEPPQNISANE